MFDRLSGAFSGAMKSLSGRGKISEANVREAMGDVRNALLEADVHIEVVQTFCDEVVEKALGREVTKSLRPGEEMIGVVHEELIRILGGDPQAAGDVPEQAPDPVMRVSPGPTVVMMCGLQGSGKTTTCGKLAAFLKKRGRSVMLAAADLQRPAAVEQLETVARQVNEEMPGGAQVHFYAERDKVAEYGKAVGVAVRVCQNALSAARKQGVDTLILDTAGRLHINDDLMDELHRINRSLNPHQIFLVTDAMTGQDAINSARSFHERLEVDGVILTKFDSDTRGGAAISVRHVTGAPIKFIGTGEKLDALEAFVPERVAGRILGMGDVVSLVEKAKEEVSEEEAAELQAKMAKGEMTMDDFVSQIKKLRRMGPLKQIMGMLPGVGQALKDIDVDEKQFDRIEAMVSSMTPEERRKPGKVDNSRRRRISAGSGTQTSEVSKLTKQFDTVSKLFKSMSGGGGMGAMGQMRAAQQMGAGGMPGMAGMPSLSTKRGTRSGGSKRYKKRRK